MIVCNPKYEKIVLHCLTRCFIFTFTGKLKSSADSMCGTYDLSKPNGYCPLLSMNGVDSTIRRWWQRRTTLDVRKIYRKPNF